MINKILLPLDGSKLAECALPYVMELAEKLGAQVTVVSVTNHTQGYWPFEDPSQPSGLRLTPVGVCTMEEHAANYLDQVTAQFEKKGIKIVKKVVCGKTAEEIIAYANANHSDLIVMSSHGRSGPAKLMRGSIADRVLKSAHIPVMIVRAPNC